MVSTVDPLPDNPERVDAPAVFIPTADTWVAALSLFTDQVNTLGAEVQVLGDATQVNADAAAASAATSASNANFVGNWSDQTGAANIPYSVFEDGRFYQLLQNLADVTTSQPTLVNTDWAVIPDIGTVIHVFKPATTARNSTTTRTIDPDLDITVPAGRWMWQAMVTFISRVTTTGGIDFRLGILGAGSSNGKGVINTNGNFVTNPDTFFTVAISLIQQDTFVAINNSNSLAGYGSFTVASSANFGLEWAQKVSSADDTEVVLDSWITLTKVGN